jgi:hypothetical protein
MYITISHQILHGDNNYFIHQSGEVENITTGNILTKNINKHGYVNVTLTKGKDGKQKKILIHIILGQCFLPNPDNKSTIDHINRTRTDNRLINLRWATRSEQAFNRKKRCFYTTTRLGISGYKYIREEKRKNKSKYAFHYRDGNKRHYKLLDSIDEAIEYRNNYLKNINDKLWDCVKNF